MTEDDVKKMEEVVGSEEVSAEVQKAWRKEQIEGFKKAEASLVMTWRFHKLMRNDAQMSTAFEELKKIREALSVLENNF